MQGHYEGRGSGVAAQCLLHWRHIICGIFRRITYSLNSSSKPVHADLKSVPYVLLLCVFL